MPGATLRYDFREAAKVERLLQELRGFDRFELLDGVGAIAETQTRRRISDEKTSPDGVRWPSWSESYAQTRPPGKSLLQDSGALLDSVAYYVEGDAVFVGEGVEYAHVHQDGARIPAHVIRARNGKGLAFNGIVRRSVQFPGATIPARPSLGVSDENGEEITAEIVAFFDDLVQLTVKR